MRRRTALETAGHAEPDLLQAALTAAAAENGVPVGGPDCDRLRAFHSGAAPRGDAMVRREPGGGGGFGG